MKQQVAVLKQNIKKGPGKMMTLLNSQIAKMNKMKKDAVQARLLENKEYHKQLVKCKTMQDAMYKAIVVMKTIYKKVPALLQVESQRAWQDQAEAAGGMVVLGFGAPAAAASPAKPRSLLTLLGLIGKFLVRQEAEMR